MGAPIIVAPERIKHGHSADYYAAMTGKAAAILKLFLAPDPWNVNRAVAERAAAEWLAYDAQGPQFEEGL